MAREKQRLASPGGSTPTATAELGPSGSGGWTLTLGGDWTQAAKRPPLAPFQDELPGAGVLYFSVRQLASWDSSLAIFVYQVMQLAGSSGLQCDRSGLPAGVCALLDLAAGGEAVDLPGPSPATAGGLLARIGGGALQRLGWSRDALAFLGGSARAAARMLRGRARWRWVDLGYFLYDCGPGALGIVSLIAFLVGVILAFVGALQLQTFGVQIYVANLVGIGMARDMGAMMTGIILAGRTGAAYAAQLGTMQVNEEIDALRTFGIDPLEFLVLPRLFALVAMLPLLCCYADLLGILGGGVVCVSLFDITPLQYLEQTRQAVPLHHFAGGLIKATVYGVVVALAGCHRGLACGRSAAAVGEATTAAVVTAIVWIVVWCALLTVVFNLIGV
jgi:phospholipid/cholesterol/gamma-HCH transport system permease protein